MNNYKVNFLLRTDKENSQGQQPIIFTLSIANQLRKLNTGISVLPELWALDSKQIIYRNRKEAKTLLPNIDFDTLPLLEDGKRMNAVLSKIRTNVEELIQLHEIQKKEYSSDSIFEDYKLQKLKLNKKEESTDLVFDYIDKYIEDNKPSRVKGSLSVYKSLKTHLRSFFQEERNIKVKFTEMNYDFLQSFQNFLFEHTTKQKKTLNNITVAKQLSTLKTFLGYARRGGVIVNEGYKDFAIKRQRLEVIALDETEFYRLYNLDLSKNLRLNKVRDVFCFSCMVGYRYSDLEQLEHYHIKSDTITLTTKKTKKPIVTPLNKIAKSILAKYQTNIKPIPVISNQKYNEYLTELCQLAELNDEIEIIRFRGSERLVKVEPKWKLITAHSGRKSFASMLLAKGVAAQIIMELGGWTDFKSFQRYIKVNEDTMRNAVLNAWG